MDEWLNKIHLGDCLELMAKMPAACIDLMVTSPPYNLLNSSGGGMRGGGHGLWPNAQLRHGYAGGNGDNLPRPEYIAQERRVLAEGMRLLKRDGAIFYNHKWRVQNGLLQDQKEILAGFPVRQIIVWQRAGGINFNRSYLLPTYEVIYLIPKSEAFKLAESMDPAHPKAASGMTDIWYVPQDLKNNHPAPFPIDIPRRCIEITDAKIILDPYMGSGTTALAAEMLGRQWIGMEIAQPYINQANKRLAEWRATTPEARLRAIALEEKEQ